ncbi:MAG: type II toxin-antitoxin system RelE/ParE family toxin [Campylobacter lanienae]|uniref:type II toxin-antitoxin system RelE/ParE family toxin n=1 Tax=Campylobacter sp. TaxID=205 RepID=UPI002973BBEA|nr:type II toxin-antitoxin system RelE/ParE family toxin [Campylobacter sp.]MDD7324236.1 type II toxin-antitoxin system RelE/ParE family toxin [Campylobacteraceae bacterium]MDY2818131.1 type II toxin-antitoxin system RelE/ParE family toxin [Campylobacter lanienae]MCI6578668.1 type II toxin-antitoxin system RelE/ParE family toxin [Campylobacter sp.]MDD7741965.1 type II toxin-antitoxin system RelE/ParE family toxin [Campylobacteraceae bacterium]MDY4120619.1 type II toxin-antitoxin system RelE/Pa
MNFEFDDRFIKALNDIESFIALDNLERAEKFKNDIIDKISSLDFMPKRCRKSTLANDESIRDLIFKGYIIVFKIQNDTIKVLYIYKENEPKMIF